MCFNKLTNFFVKSKTELFNGLKHTLLRVLFLKQLSMKNIIKLSLAAFLVMVIAVSCKKLDRPTLGDYPKDQDPRFPLYPGGPLKFYTAFDGTSTNKLMNAVDSIRANFPADNPFTSITGISGKGVQGVDQKAIKYPSANDWAKSTSFTVAFWEKNSVPTGGSPQWLFSLPSKDFWHQSAFTAFFDHDAAGSNTSVATVKLIIQDQWLEFTGANRMPGNLLNGSWHHMAFVYDETTSKMSYYVDGQPLTGLPASITDVKRGSNPRGPMDFKNTYNFVVGGWNKHANLGQGAPGDGWIQSWQGGLDQFRLYGKALTASEVLALFNSRL